MAPRNDQQIDTQQKRKSARAFRERLRELAEAEGKFTPSTWLLARLNDEVPETVAKKLDAEGKDRLALGLVQYELPRLAAIEAEVSQVDKSQEEWLDELDPANDDRNASPQEEKTA